MIASEAIADKIDETMGRIPNGDRSIDDVEDISDFEDVRNGNNQVGSSSTGYGSAEPFSATNPFRKSPNQDATFEETYADIEKFLAAQEGTNEAAKGPEKSNPPPPSPEPQTNPQEEDSQELVPLGIVTPQEKIETITID